MENCEEKRKSNIDARIERKSFLIEKKILMQEFCEVIILIAIWLAEYSNL